MSVAGLLDSISPASIYLLINSKPKEAVSALPIFRDEIVNKTDQKFIFNRIRISKNGHRFEVSNHIPITSVVFP